jgi:hypothetical protein
MALQFILPRLLYAAIHKQTNTRFQESKKGTIEMIDSRIGRRIASLAVLGLLGLGSSAVLAECMSVRGAFEETLTSGCGSPVGLCTNVQMYGSVKGTGVFAATSVTPTVDTATTGVVFITGNSTLNVRMGTRSGTIMVKNAASFHAVGDGEIADILVIAAGQGGFAGATGTIRAVGNLTGGTGFSTYEGTVCLP